MPLPPEPLRIIYASNTDKEGQMSAARDRLNQLLQKAQTGDSASLVIDRLLGLLIIANVLAVTCETVDSIYARYAGFFYWFEFISVSLFSVEYILRLWSSASNTDSKYRSDFSRRIGYVLSPSGLIDLIAILPAFLPMLFPGLDLRWLRVLRLMRMVKLSHYSTALEDFFSALYHERSAFLSAFYLFCVTLFFSSSLIYLAEHVVQPDAFGSIPQSLWWSLITLTTVGYGDVSPLTPIGKVIGGITALMGVCVVALMTGIVASAFSAQQERKKHLLEAEVTEALADGIITPEELAKIRELQRQLNLDDDYVNALIGLISDRSRSHHKTP